MNLRPLHIFILTLCIMLGGCAIPSDAPVSEPGTVREYFWQPGMGEIHYDVYNGLNTAPVDHTITFTLQGDTIHALDKANGNTGRISSRVGFNSVDLIDIQSTALFPLPDGAYISAHSTEQKKKQYLPISNFLYLDDRTVAFTRNSVYYTSDRTNWIKSETPIAGPVTATCAVSDTRFYAGTANGKLYLSEDGGKRWNLIKSVDKPILSIVRDVATIYFAVQDLGVYSTKSGNFARVGKDLPSISGLAIIPSSFGKTLLASTSDRGLLRVDLEGNGLWGELTSGISSEWMTGVYANGFQVLATMKNGDYYVSTDTAKSWQRGTTQVGAVSAMFTTGSVAYEKGAMATSNGWIITTDMDSPQTVHLASIGSAITAIHRTLPDQLIIASDNGLERVGKTGAREQMGPYDLVPDSSRGEFVLLQSESGGALIAGDSWHAGNLYMPQAGYFPITARVMEQLDSLSVDDLSFGDVFVVRYAFETDGQPAPLTPYWMIYFSRGIGPVMIDRIADQSQLTNPISRAVYKGRR